MYVRPAARSRGVATALLAALEDTAVSLGYTAVRLDTGPKQVHAQRLYRAAGYVDVPPYNDNPFACFWGEKRLRVRLALPPAVRMPGRVGQSGTGLLGVCSAAHTITSCSGSRPQATARLSARPGCRPVPASSAICTLAGKTAARVATLAAAAHRVRRTSPAAQTSSTTPLA